MFYRQEEQLTYDDVLLVPQKRLKSRSDADTSSKLDSISLRLPVMSANMKSVTWYEMAGAMYDAGGIGVLHRAASIEERLSCLIDLTEDEKSAFMSLGLKDPVEAIRDFARFTRHFNLDVANAYADDIADKIKEIKDAAPDCFLMVGNIATTEGAQFLAESGADAIKVGIGPGSSCTTRIVTGHGFPQFSAVYNCSQAVDLPVIADGGIKDVGDVAKALGAGAAAVMSGYLFAGCDESAGQDIGDKKEYFGMASAKGIVKPGRLEGIVGSVEKTGPVREVMDKIRAGLQSAMSYSGARTIAEFQRKAKFIKVTTHTLRENYPRV